MNQYELRQIGELFDQKITLVDAPRMARKSIRGKVVRYTPPERVQFTMRRSTGPPRAMDAISTPKGSHLNRLGQHP
jgi:hypothetical protein